MLFFGVCVVMDVCASFVVHHDLPHGVNRNCIAMLVMDVDNDDVSIHDDVRVAKHRVCVMSP